MSWKSIGRLFSGIKGAYNDINPATLTGAIDVIVVQQRDGSFTCGPFHVRFGKLTAFSPADKTVEVYINGELVEFLHMCLSNYGDAYFVDSSENDTGESYGELSVRIQDAVCDDAWSSLSKRKWRRKLRRDSAMSEPDATSEFMTKDISVSENEEYEVSSDCENREELTVSGIMNVNNCQFSSDSNLHCRNSLENEFHWEWVQSDIVKSDSSSGSSLEITVNDISENAHNNTEIKSDSHTSFDKGLYLEDLVTSNIDQNVKEAYIYPPTHSNLSQNSGTNHESNCLDHGYRSDNEQSTRSLSPTNFHPLTFRLSLCGGLSAETTLAEDKFLEYMVSYEEFIRDPHSILNNPNLVIYLNGRYCNWQMAAPSLISHTAFQTELPYSTMQRLESLYLPKRQSRLSSWFSWRANQSRTFNNVETSLENKGGPESTVAATDYKFEQLAETSVTHKKSKTNKLTSVEIARLNLKPGRNDVEFRVTTKYQGTCTCSASIFYWHWYDRVVVSDVDGTITRSDVLGHLLPMLGRDWTHDGVARLYNKIASNGYKFLYLSARALGQAGITRSYLRQVVQNSNFTLPDGPILLSPSSLLHAFHQEVIIKKPEHFKTKCLKDVSSLFPSDVSPLYSGFGNKVNDVWAYQNAGIERHRIFTIRPSGVVKNEYQPDKSTSYEELSDLADLYFPYHKTADNEIQTPESDNIKLSSVDVIYPTTDMSSFSSFAFWRNTDYELSFDPTQKQSSKDNNETALA